MEENAIGGLFFNSARASTPKDWPDHIPVVENKLKVKFTNEDHAIIEYLYFEETE
jgi:hypothetical protein